MSWKKITKETYDRIAKDYAERDKANVPESKDVIDALNYFSEKLEEGSFILDIGSGGGRDAKFLSDKNFKVTGIDNSTEMLRSAESNAPKATFMEMDFEDLKFPDNSFDGIWANASLHHVPKINLPATLEKIYQILKNDGLFFIKIKQGESDGIRENEKFGEKIQRWFSYYKKDEVADILEKIGFQIIKSEITNDGEWVDILAKK